MAELPSPEEIMAQMPADAGMPPEAAMQEQPGVPPGMPPGMPPGAEGLPPEAMPMDGGAQDLDALLAQLEGAQIVPEPGPPDPMAQFAEYAQGMGGQQAPDESSLLLSDRIEQLEGRLAQQQENLNKEREFSETVRVRKSIDNAVVKAMSGITSGNDKLDKAAAGFIEGAIVYRIAQQSQKNPNASVDTDAIKRYADATAKALSRWAMERAKQEGEKASGRKAAAGAQARPQPGQFDIKSDDDFNKFVQAYAKLS